MEILEAQKQVDAYINSYKEGYFSVYENLARLMEEVGEFSREINHLYGQKKKKKSEDLKKNLQSEAGDLLFSVLTLANQLEINLDEAFVEVLKKYKNRDHDRWTPKASEAKP